MLTGKLYACGRMGRIGEWDLVTYKKGPERVTHQGEDIYSVMTHGDIMWVGDEDGTIHSIDLAAGVKCRPPSPIRGTLTAKLGEKIIGGSHEYHRSSVEVVHNSILSP